MNVRTSLYSNCIRSLSEDLVDKPALENRNEPLINGYGSIATDTSSQSSRRNGSSPDTKGFKNLIINGYEDLSSHKRIKSAKQSSSGETYKRKNSIEKYGNHKGENNDLNGYQRKGLLDNSPEDSIYTDIMKNLCKSIKKLKNQYLFLTELKEYYEKRSKFMRDVFNISYPQLDTNNTNDMNKILCDVYLYLDNSKTKILISLLVLRTILRKKLNGEQITDNLMYAIKYGLKDSLDYQIIFKEKLLGLKYHLSSIIEKSEENFHSSKSFTSIEFEKSSFYTKKMFKSIKNCIKKSDDIRFNISKSHKLLDHIMSKCKIVEKSDQIPLDDEYYQKLEKPTQFKCELSINTSKLFESFDINKLTDLTNLAIYEVVNDLDVQSNQMSKNDKINLTYIFLDKLKDELRLKIEECSDFTAIQSYITTESKKLDFMDSNSDDAKHIRKEIQGAKLKLRVTIMEMVSQDLELADKSVSSEISNKLKSILADVSIKLNKIEQYTNEIEKLFSTFYIFTNVMTNPTSTNSNYNFDINDSDMLNWIVTKNNHNDDNIDNFNNKTHTTIKTKDTIIRELCSICLQLILGYDSKYRIRLECDHVFHKPCLDEWITKNKTCPNCRQLGINHCKNKFIKMDPPCSQIINSGDLNSTYNTMLNNKNRILHDLKNLLNEMEQNHQKIIQIKSNLNLIRYSTFKQPKLNLYLILQECFCSELEYIYSPIKDIKLLISITHELSRLSGLEVTNN